MYRLVGLVRNVRMFMKPLTQEELDHYEGDALITGGAAGIGFAAAEYLAQRGKNLYLIDYNAEQLEATKTLLEKKYNIKVTTEQMDLTKLLDPYTYHSFTRRINQKKIGICFNNAGIAEQSVNQFLQNSHSHLTK